MLALEDLSGLFRELRSMEDIRHTRHKHTHHHRHHHLQQYQLWLDQLQLRPRQLWTPRPKEHECRTCHPTIKMRATCIPTSGYRRSTCLRLYRLLGTLQRHCHRRIMHRSPPRPPRDRTAATHHHHHQAHLSAASALTPAPQTRTSRSNPRTSNKRGTAHTHVLHPLTRSSSCLAIPESAEDSATSVAEEASSKASGWATKRVSVALGLVASSDERKPKSKRISSVNRECEEIVNVKLR